MIKHRASSDVIGNVIIIFIINVVAIVVWDVVVVIVWDVVVVLVVWDVFIVVWDVVVIVVWVVVIVVEKGLKCYSCSNTHVKTIHIVVWIKVFKR